MMAKTKTKKAKKPTTRKKLIKTKAVTSKRIKPTKVVRKTVKHVKSKPAAQPVSVDEAIKVVSIDPDVVAFEKEASAEFLAGRASLAAEIVPVKKKNYLNNKDLLAAVMKSKEQGSMTNLLAHMIQTLCKRYAKKGNFANYSYNDDMQGYAMMMVVKTWNAFDPKKSSNPFAFFTQCIKNSFIQFLNVEKRQRNIKNDMLIDSGLNPSYSYQIDHERAQRMHTENDEPTPAVKVESFGGVAENVAN